jgi:hypothetical protein
MFPVQTPSILGCGGDRFWLTLAVFLDPIISWKILFQDCLLNKFGHPPAHTVCTKHLHSYPSIRSAYHIDNKNDYYFLQKKYFYYYLRLLLFSPKKKFIYDLFIFMISYAIFIWGVKLFRL